MSVDDKRLLELCDLVTSGRADDQHARELESLMLNDLEARRAFLNWSAMHVDLGNIIQASHSRITLFDQLEQHTVSRSKFRRSVWLLALAASLLLIIVSVKWNQSEDLQAAATDRTIDPLASLAIDADPPAGVVIDGVAIVNRVEDAMWVASSRPVAAGDLIKASHWIELESGIAEIEFGQGAVVVLEGPARFSAESTSLGLLAYGKLAAVVPPWAEGFQIDTPAVEVVDRGTEFVVEVSQDEQVTVGVTKGEVEVFKQEPWGASAAEKTKHRLFAGNALHASGSDFNAAAFDEEWHSLSQRLPSRPDHTQVEVIAKYRRDYISGVSNKPMRENNWRYYANYWSSHNDLEGYQELLWDSQRKVYDPNGDVGRLAGDRLNASNFSYRGGHPGQGRDQSKDDLDHYVIAAYQVPKSGDYRIESGWLVRAESRNDLSNQAVDLRVWVNSRSDLIEATCNHDGLLQFQGEIGQLVAGDWIYFGVGPQTISYNDRFEWDFAIVRTIEEITN